MRKRRRWKYTFYGDLLIASLATFIAMGVMILGLYQLVQIIIYLFWV